MPPRGGTINRCGSTHFYSVVLCLLLTFTGLFQSDHELCLLEPALTVMPSPNRPDITVGACVILLALIPLGPSAASDVPIKVIFSRQV